MIKYWHIHQVAVSLIIAGSMYGSEARNEYAREGEREEKSVATLRAVLREHTGWIVHNPTAHSVVTPLKKSRIGLFKASLQQCCGESLAWGVQEQTEDLDSGGFSMGLFSQESFSDAPRNRFFPSVIISTPDIDFYINLYRDCHIWKPIVLNSALGRLLVVDESLCTMRLYEFHTGKVTVFEHGMEILPFNKFNGVECNSSGRPCGECGSHSCVTALQTVTLSSLDCFVRDLALVKTGYSWRKPVLREGGAAHQVMRRQREYPAPALCSLVHFDLEGGRYGNGRAVLIKHLQRGLYAYLACEEGPCVVSVDRRNNLLHAYGMPGSSLFHTKIRLALGTLKRNKIPMFISLKKKRFFIHSETDVRAVTDASCVVDTLSPLVTTVPTSVFDLVESEEDVEK